MNPWDEGAKAWLEGQLMGDCPYPPESDRAINWERGYIATHRAKLNEDGPNRRRYGEDKGNG